ncbi:sulfatase-like hydrolase/transferase [Saccharospirillum alexandrii]|uniref:sulfatase-like hydrolase/transferase n=1 Tax=Saccharospirillum alexandrii TaxID=2448477 RepID=UPI000FD84C6C|nr:sulfatase-like hydrolase/transferase [Saccharospirillum alexandrii]
MNAVKNTLFIMIDQLRWDALSCYGNTVVDTPNIDRLAKRGVRFNNAYTQGTSCGNSRASFYTGLHMRSHGATWNDWPFSLSEWTLADYLKPLNQRVVLLGKTHMKPDLDGMDRLGIEPGSELGQRLYNAGFTEGEHDDGLHPEGPMGKYSKQEPRYNAYLRAHGFEGDNPWLEWANAAETDNGDIVSGFYLEHAHRPARIPKEHSETAYLTNRIIDTIDELGDDAWCLHASYIKPHWPCIAPDPYHSLYRDADFGRAVKSEAERQDPHPIYRQFMQLGVSQTFSDDEKRAHVLPAYFGLVKEVDDHIGRLLDHLDAKGLTDDTLIVLTADHGDYLGDHWLGEKDLFHQPSVKLPLIVVDPRADANVTRGQQCDALVGAIDVLPTLIECAGGQVSEHEHRLEGRSLLPFLHQTPSPFERDFIVAEDDYGRLPVAAQLGVDALAARMTMAFNGRYKLVHCPGFPDMLFDLHNDPSELVDLGRDPGYESVRRALRDQLLDWSATLHNRRAVSREMEQNANGLSRRQGILIGFWDRESVPEAMKPPLSIGVK